MRTVLETPETLTAEARELLGRLATALDDASMPRRRILRQVVEARLAAAAVREAAEEAAAQAQAFRGSRG